MPAFFDTWFQMLLNGPHVPMCPGVKRGCPDQPLTRGSFIRLCSRLGSIDKGHWKGRPRSLFSSIQLKHQLLNQRLLFIGTLIVLIDWQVVKLSVHWAWHNDWLFSHPRKHPFFCHTWYKSKEMFKWRHRMGVNYLKNKRTQSCVAFYSAVGSQIRAEMLPSEQVRAFLTHFWVISNHPLHLQAMPRNNLLFFPSLEHTLGL